MRDKLERLEDAQRGMDLERIRTFDNVLIGALSRCVSDAVWDDCVRLADNGSAYLSSRTNHA